MARKLTLTQLRAKAEKLNSQAKKLRDRLDKIQASQRPLAKELQYAEGYTCQAGILHHEKCTCESVSRVRD